jgi:hypothetical protein
MSGIIGTSKSKSGVVGRSQDTAKAWVFFNGGSVSGTGTGGIVNSYNVSSLTDNGAGNHSINYIVPMSTVDYPVISTGYNYDILTSARSETTTSCQVNSQNVNGTLALVDMAKFKVVIFGG